MTTWDDYQLSKNPKFQAVLEEMGRMHDNKQSDYGRDNDPFANIRGSQEWGIKPWIGAMIRANDKLKRLQKFAQDGILVNEGVEDSMLDLAVYSAIAYILYKEEAGKG